MVWTLSPPSRPQWSNNLKLNIDWKPPVNQLWMNPNWVYGQGEMTTELGSYLDTRWWVRLIPCSHSLEAFLWRILQYLCWWSYTSFGYGGPWSKTPPKHGSPGFNPRISSLQATFLAQPITPNGLPFCNNVSKKNIYTNNWNFLGSPCSQWEWPLGIQWMYKKA
jgi:hypothetical protein